MATINFGAAGTAVVGSGTNPVLTIVEPASGPTYLNLLCISWKDESINPPVIATSSGTWVLLQVVKNSVVISSGTNVGSDLVAVYYAWGTSPSGTTATFTGSVGQCQGVIMNYVPSTGSSVFDLEWSFAEDTAIGANLSAASAVNMLTQPGDVMIAVAGIRSSLGTVTTPTLTASGTTFGTVNTRVNNASATGQGGRIYIADATVSSGTETGAPTFGYTNSDTTQAGVVLLINLRLRNVAYYDQGAVAHGNGSSPVLNVAQLTSSPDLTDTRHYMVIGWKDTSIPEPVVAATTGTWARLAEFINSTQVVTGADVGSGGIVVYYADGACPSGTTVTFTGTVGDALAYVTSVIKDPTMSINHAYSFGEKNTSSANYSATATTAFFGTAGDTVLAYTFDTRGSTAPASTSFTQTTPGCTVGAAMARQNNPDTNGDKASIYSSDQAIISGTQTTGSTFGFTLAGSSQGVSIFLRLRAVLTPSLSVVPLTNFYQTVGYVATAGGLSTFTQFELQRQDNTGFPSSDVRGGQLQTITGTSVVLDDYEFRFGSSDVESSTNLTTWILNCYDSHGVLAVSVQVQRTPYNDWTNSVATEQSNPIGSLANTFIGVPLSPGDNFPVVVNEFTEFAFKGNVLSNSHVLGRQNPVVSIDVGTGHTGSFKLLVPDSLASNGGNPFIGSIGASSRLRDYTDVLREGQILLFRSVEPSFSGIDMFYFVVDTATVTRTTKAIGSQILPMFVVEVSFIEVDAPINDHVISATSWQDVLNTFVSWRDVKNTYTTWLGVLENPTA